MATFDPNRVGPGTFELVKDPSTGEYKLNQVGFTKLPDLSLPTIDQAPYVIPDDGDDDTGDDNQTPDPGTGGGGSGGGGGPDQTFINFPTPDGEQDFTGEQTFKNIQKQATDIGKADMGIQMEDISAGSDNRRALAKYNEALANYNRITGNIRELNASGQATDTDRRAYDISRNNAQNELDEARKNYESTIVNISGAPIGDFSQGPRTVPTGTLTGGATQTQPAVEDIGKTFRSETDKFKTRFDPTKIEPAEVDSNIFTKAKDVVSNSKPVQLLGIGVRMAATALENALVSPQQQALNRSNKNALSAVGYKTRGELGGSTDPGRIAGNPADNVFAGMNATSARGNIMTGSANRIKTRETVGIQRVEARYGKNSKQAKDFRAKTETFKDQRQQVLDKQREQQAKINKETMNQGPPSQSGGGGDSPGGKSIVCTAMYQTTGLQDWAKAMKIWYIYQKRYLTIQHQEGYHKLFKPFVKGMHKSNIIKAIGAHFAKHRTQHLKHVMFNSKPSLLGKIYNKILEPICYWAGRK